MAVKSIWVQAPFKEQGHFEKKEVVVGTEKREVRGTMLRRGGVEEVPLYQEQDVWVTTDTSITEIDGEKFNQLIEKAVTELDDEGFDIIAITPVISGHHDSKFSMMHNTLWGYGGSHTEGVTILAKSR